MSMYMRITTKSAERSAESLVLSLLPGFKDREKRRQENYLLGSEKITTVGARDQSHADGLSGSR